MRDMKIINALALSVLVSLSSSAQTNELRRSIERPDSPMLQGKTGWSGSFFVASGGFQNEDFDIVYTGNVVTVENGIITSVIGVSEQQRREEAAREENAKSPKETVQKHEDEEKSNGSVMRIADKIKREKASFEINTTNTAGSAAFNFKDNGGYFSIVYTDGVLGEACSIGAWWSVFAKDFIRVRSNSDIGWKFGQKDFPLSAAEFEKWNWEWQLRRRERVLHVGDVVAFMDTFRKNHICAVRVVKVLDRIRGADRNELQIEYRIY